MTETKGLTSGAIAMVTGATSGIGAALTEALLAKGCKVIGADYDGMGLRVIEVAPGVARPAFAKTRYQGDAARADAFYESFPAVLEAEDVARTTIFSLEQPPHVTLGEILMFPSHGRRVR